MAAITGAAIAVAGIAANVIGQEEQKKKANAAERDAQSRLDATLANRQATVNPYSNLSVSTKEAEFQNQSVDQSLANTLDTAKQSGMGAGSATALAEAALKSKQNIAATIGTQEAENKRLEAEGRKFQFNSNEQRTNMDLNRYSSLQSQYAQQVQDANAAMWSSIGSGTMGIGAGLSKAYS